MKETITSRVGRLISGSFNTLVAAVENAVPETTMEEAIRELDGAIDEVRAELGRVVANKHMANSRLTDENRKHASLAENIEVAVEQGRDDLAEAAIAKQLDIEAQIPVLEATVTDCVQQEKDLDAYIAALQAKKREMQEELRLYRESLRDVSVVAAGSSTFSTDSHSHVTSRAEKAGAAFDRIMEKTTGMTASRSPVLGENATKVAQLEELAHKNRVSERLAAIKNKLDSKK